MRAKRKTLLLPHGTQHNAILTCRPIKTAWGDRRSCGQVENIVMLHLYYNDLVKKCFDVANIDDVKQAQMAKEYIKLMIKKINWGPDKRTLEGLVTNLNKLIYKEKKRKATASGEPNCL